ncbi:MAG TPA: CDP-diacylglycerol--serine O-phosphatidyltransferase [Dongiaceae bacterium]|jgi:CDP-diacylglycerol--serine O-phosphatidyltransferase|nr:CDP-diacylglycerol--serine O-phosphatidyltransferase [Dongiaceae bacterium]
MMRPLPRPRLKDYSLNRLIPNILTLLALSAGLSAIRFALAGKWEACLIAVGIAAIFDALDGRIARILDSTSKFGAELDSLSDFVSFGVAPALILYQWQLHRIPALGWAMTLLYAICTALRLARFNTKLENKDLPAWTTRFFSGVPAPAGAGLALLPLIADLAYPGVGFDTAGFTAFSCVAVAALMVSRLPTFSFKRVAVRPAHVLPTMVIVALYASCLVSTPWNTLIVTLLGYLATLPFSSLSYRKLSQTRHLVDPDYQQERL